ncbi:hypothetical protein ACFB49_33880 [Sphingomonas sp. DBB INV C78]|uniref:hypothetical protein n=1 Tax=Sphingomonas sp. DBB INV C78 TaxID=3349434 RepID=UPI0036D36CB1
MKAAILPAFMLAIVTPALAQDAQVQQAVATAPQGNVWILPANTELTVTPNSGVSSKTMKEGDVFTISTVYDVLMNNYIVLPKGTRGQGKVTWRTGKGAFGKSAKMDIAFEWIEIGGRRITIEGKHRQEGQGNTAATIGAVVAVGPFGAFVTGKSAEVPNGMQLKAFTAEPIQFQANGLQAAPQQASLVAGGPAVSQGTSPLVTPVASGDHAQ